jgi:transposase InsO family protein
LRGNGTLGRVSKQRDRFQIAFRCDRCARRHGRAQILATANRDATPNAWGIRPPDGWRLWYARRLPKRVRLAETPQSLTVVSAGGAPHGPRKRMGLVVQPGHRLILVPLTAPAAALDCPDCPARPRLSRAKLVELAEQTLAAGRRDVYV